VKSAEPFIVSGPMGESHHPPCAALSQDDDHGGAGDVYMVAEPMASRVHELLQAGAVALVPGDRCVVHGSTGWHDVAATETGIICSCIAGTRGQLCAHVCACSVLWAEVGVDG
jgi:hypothetical protein